jgi:prefoldin subunit 5
MGNKKKWYQYVGVRAAFIIAIGGIIVAGINAWSNQSKLAKDNEQYKKDVSNLKEELKNKNSEIQRLETQLTPFKTIALEKYTGTEQERLNKLSERIKELENPLNKPIASAEAQVTVIVKSDEEVATRYMNEGGLLSFVKNRQSLLLLADTQSNVKQTGKGEVIYKGIFHMKDNLSAIGKPIETLQTSDIIQIRFRRIPENSQVIGGKAIVVLNGNTRFEFEISPQQMYGKDIIIRNIKSKFLIRQSIGL